MANTQQITKKTLLLQYLLEQGLRVFTNAEVKAVASQLNITPTYTNLILTSLIKDGWIRSIRRGIYAFTAVTGIQPIHEFELAMQLVKPAMISHYSAFYYHELTDQVPRDIFVSTLKGNHVPQLGAREHRAGFKLDGVHYRIMQLNQERFLAALRLEKEKVFFKILT
jgi:predicted transcriptional regulator of viral defense system